MTRSGPFLVALDLGTGSVRAHLLDVRGVRVASASRPVRLDAQGRPLGGSILWMDRRAGAEAAHLASLLDPEIFLAKPLWIRRHEPERYIRTRCFVGSKDDGIRRSTRCTPRTPRAIGRIR